MFSSLLSIDFSLSKTLIVVAAVAAIASFDLLERYKNRPGHYIFGVLLGTVLAVILISATKLLVTPGLRDNVHIVAVGVVFIFLLWRLLFGPWEVTTKATILGTFLFWVSLNMLWMKPPEERLAYFLSALIALVPAIIWCWIFLSYHKEKISLVLLMFFAGMLATFPVLFYDALVRHGVELNFFFFRVVPESFSRMSETFVSGQLTTLAPLRKTLLMVLMSFIFVGLIEEFSKYWVLRKSGRQFFTSIDDVMQFAIIVAIGFSFAENLANPTYFVSFVKSYFGNTADGSDFSEFFGNILGRSVLTSMVHIVSTGVMGYYLGFALFAGPYLQEAHSRGKRHWIIEYIHRIMRLDEISIFRQKMILTGLVLAITLHTASNFLVTLPDVLPGNPTSLGGVLGFAEGSYLDSISFLLLPALFYVVGGFWLLTYLFERKESMKERGHLVSVDTFVTSES